MQAEFQIAYSHVSQQFGHVCTLKKATLDGKKFECLYKEMEFKSDKVFYTTHCTSRRHWSLMEMFIAKIIHLKIKLIT